MSCEIRSMITRYPLGSAIFTPPSLTNSADTPSIFMLLIFSTTAGGKVFSMPNKIPIFFMTIAPVQTLLATSHTTPTLCHSEEHSAEESGFPPATRRTHIPRVARDDNHGV